MKRKKKKLSKPTYLREVQIRFKKKRIKADSPVGKSITDSHLVYLLFKDLQNETKEKLITISVDSKLKIICFEVVAMGSSQAVFAKPFEAIRAAIPLSPYGFIIVHNHSSGDPRPSKEDKSFTKRLKKITDAGGALLLDHIIIGYENYFSFSDQGLLD